MKEPVTPYGIREAVKRLAPTDTADGFELVMLMHFERSREDWPRRLPPHPSWEDYARAYVAQSRWDAQRPAHVIAEMRCRYLPRPDEALPSGRSEWSRTPPPDPV